MAPSRRRVAFEDTFAMPTPPEITKHHEPTANANPWVGEAPRAGPIAIVGYDETWPLQFESVAARVMSALADAALGIEHVGSTSVPGLSAKPVIDIDLTVADPSDEASYVPALARAGFTLVIREPDWHQHRLLTLPDPRSNLHVFGADCPELVRHRMFRDWLRSNPDDLEYYRRAKLAAASAYADGSGTVAAYNRHKQLALREIYERMFRANGLLP